MSAPPSVVEILAATPPFTSLRREVLERLAAACEERSLPAGAAVVTEGDDDDSLFVLLDGQAEVQLGPSRTPIAALGFGDSFGETAVLTGSPRSASVVALSDLRFLRLDGEAVRSVAAASPKARVALEGVMEELARARLIREVTTFAALDDTTRRALARSTVRRRLGDGEVFFSQGDHAQAAYLIISGNVRLLREAGGASADIARVGPGTLLGETAVLTGSPRTATAVAATDLELLEISEGALSEVLGSDAETSRRVTELVRLRYRPRRAEGIEVHAKQPPEDDTVAVLKDPRHHRYFRLSEQGLFVWERLDGEHNVRDLAVEGMDRFRAFAPDAIAQLLARLEASGFVHGAGLTSSTVEGQLLAGRAYRALTWTKEIPALHRLTDAVYRGGGRALFTWPAQVLLAAVALAGPVTLVASADRAQAAVATVGGVGWALLLGFVLAAVIHDSGHALATRHYGREVRGGIGFFWLSPIVFINTSDMWLGPKRERIVVTLAGPYAHLITAGVAGLLTLVTDGLGLVIAWQFTLFAYADVLLNLSPLLELDGYYLMVHVLHRPNLRRRSLAFLVEDLPKALRDPSVLRGHGVEVAYGIASLVFVVALTAYSVVMYRIGIEPWLERVFAPTVTSAIGWTLAALLMVAVIAGIVGDVQRALATSRAERGE